MAWVFWRIRFNDGNENGYQVMNENLEPRTPCAIFHDDGTPDPDCGDYTTIDSGTEPHIGVTPPAWAPDLDA